jgi:hypothetical protein
MVAVIEESNDLSTYSFDELMGSLQTHEAKFRSKEKCNERVFYRKGESSQGRGGRGHCRFGGFEFQHDKKMSSASSRTDMAVCKPIVSENKGKNSKHAVKKKNKEQPMLFMVYTAGGRQRSTIFEEMAENEKLASSIARRNTSSKNNGDQECKFRRT